MQQIVIYLVINSISTCSGHLYAHHQEIRLRSTAYSCLSCCSCCDVGESGGKLCALCGECCLTLRINHYLLHLVGLSFTYLSKMDGHSNIKFKNRGECLISEILWRLSLLILHLDPASSLDLPLSFKARTQFEINFRTCYLFTGKKKELAYAFALFVNHSSHLFTETAYRTLSYAHSIRIRTNITEPIKEFLYNNLECILLNSTNDKW